MTSKFADGTLHFRHRHASKDKKYWPKPWRRERPLVRFARNEDTIWGDKVPQGVWPETDDEAEAFFIEQIEESGCPFAWLLQ